MPFLQPGQEQIAAVVGLVEEDDEGVEIGAAAEVAGVAVDPGQ